MSNIQRFTNKQNLLLLWSILLDELNINKSNTTMLQNLRTVFDNNIPPFSTRANPNTNIMELNKQFLSQIIIAVNRLFPQEQNIKRITISNEPVIEPYKIEDIQASRQSDFENEVKRKQMELDNYMSPQKPKPLDFADHTSDGKITAMDSLLAEKMNQRNLEIEQLQNSNYNLSNVNPEQWLMSKETSVKGEKNPIIDLNPIQNNKLKHINIDNNNNISLTVIDKQSKKVSWSDKEITSNIFQKLKKQPEVVDESIEQKQYVQQTSMPLPEVKQEQIIQQSVANPITPIVPKNEMVKQLNELNSKIDNLYIIIEKLTNMVQELKSDKQSINNEIITGINNEIITGINNEIITGINNEIANETII
jgi:hypothetical protein